jgi:hypothetical protein
VVQAVRSTRLVAAAAALSVAMVGAVAVPASGEPVVQGVAPAVPRSAVETFTAPPAAFSEDTEGEPVLEEVPLEVDEDLSEEVAEPGTSEELPFGGEPAPATADAAPGASESADVLSAENSSAGVVVVGVTWERGSAPSDLAVEVRTRVGDEWGAWEPLEADLSSGSAADGAPSDARDGTDPYLAGEVDGVEVALRHGSAEGPRDPRLSVVGSAAPDDETVEDDAAETGTQVTSGVDGDLNVDASGSAPALDAFDLGEVVPTSYVPTSVGTTSVASVPEAATVAGESIAAAGDLSTLAVAATARPTIYSRAQWGADESIMTWTPQVGRVLGATVHHTAGTNNYTAAQVPSIIRGIYTYHAVSRNWGDIGYNILVDKYGRLWEGRAGGLERAVVGAHASGVNSQAFGISVLGNYETVQIPTVAIDAAARAIAWKFSLHGLTAGATTTINGKTLQTIFGHREVGQTSCPGQYLFARLPELRTKVQAIQGATVTSAPYTRDLNRDGFPDLLVRTSSDVSLATADSAGWQTPSQVATGWNGSRVVGSGDFDGDGTADVLRIDGAGQMWLTPGTATGAFKPARVISRGWAALDLVVGGQDWDGDGHADLLARRTADGGLYLYPSNGRGGFGTVRRIGQGWNVMTGIVMMGDVTDGRPAIAARRNDGTLLMYRGDGRGSFSSAPTVVGGGWQGMTSLIGVGDMNDDGRGDLIARDASGVLWLYVGDGAGSFRGRSRLGANWNQFSAMTSPARDGRGQDLVVVRSSDGAVLHYRYDGRGDFSRQSATSAWSVGVVEAIAPGDWDGDGIPDMLTRRSDGEMFLHSGTGTGTFTTGRRISGGWQVMEQVIGVGDWTGTGAPSLMALDQHAETIYLYPSDGHGGFQTRSVVATGVGSVNHMASAGLFRGDGVSYLLTRDTSGVLHVRAGNGAALLGPPVRIGGGWEIFSRIVGVGDADGDDKPDVVGVRADGGIMLYAGNGRGSFYDARAYGAVDGVVT